MGSDLPPRPYINHKVLWPSLYHPSPFCANHHHHVRHHKLVEKSDEWQQAQSKGPVYHYARCRAVEASGRRAKEPAAWRVRRLARLRHYVSFSSSSTSFIHSLCLNLRYFSSSTRFMIFDRYANIVASHQIEFPQYYPEPRYVITLQAPVSQLTHSSSQLART